MPTVAIGGVPLFYEIEGKGDPLVLVHGSWGDHHAWDLVFSKLAESFRVLRFDRRGHSQSVWDGPQGVKEDLADIAGLMRHFDLAPAHVVGNSFGASLVLKLAAQARELFRSLAVHEPPLVSLLDPATIEATHERMKSVIALLRAGEMAEGARIFVESVGFGPGAWDLLREEERITYVRNARTWLLETEDPETLVIDLEGLSRFDKPALLTLGKQSPPFFAPVIRRIHAAMPTSELVEIPNVGHVPHLTRPDDWVKRIVAFASRV